METLLGDPKATQEKIEQIIKTPDSSGRVEKLKKLIRSDYIAKETGGTFHSEILLNQLETYKADGEKLSQIIDTSVVGIKELIDKVNAGKIVVNIKDINHFMSTLYTKNLIGNENTYKVYKEKIKDNVKSNPALILYRDDLGLIEEIKKAAGKLSKEDKYYITLSGDNPMVDEIQDAERNNYRVLNVNDLKAYISEIVSGNIKKDSYKEYKNKLLEFLEKADTNKDIKQLCEDFEQFDPKEQPEETEETEVGALKDSYNLEKALKNKVLSLLVENEEQDLSQDDLDSLIVEMLTYFVMREMNISEYRTDRAKVSKKEDRKIILADTSPVVKKKVTNLLVALTRKADPEFGNKITEFRKTEKDRRREEAEKEYMELVKAKGDKGALGWGGVLGLASSTMAYSSIAGLGAVGAIAAAPVTLLLAPVIGPAAIIAGKVIGENWNKINRANFMAGEEEKMDQDIKVDPTGLYNDVMGKFVEDDTVLLVELFEELANAHSKLTIESYSYIYRHKLSLLLEDESKKSVLTLKDLKNKLNTLSVGHQKMSIENPKLERVLDERLYEACADILKTHYDVSVEGAEGLNSEAFHNEMCRDANVDTDAKVGKSSIPEITEMLKFLGIDAPSEAGDKINPLQFLLLMLMSGGESANSFLKVMQESPVFTENMFKFLDGNKRNFTEAALYARDNMTDEEAKKSMDFAASVIDEMLRTIHKDGMISLEKHIILRIANFMHNSNMPKGRAKKILLNNVSLIKES